jgi:hypothetical protein
VRWTTRNDFLLGGHDLSAHQTYQGGRVCSGWGFWGVGDGGLTTIHQAPTVTAEVVGHGIAGLDRGAGRVRLDLVLAPHVLERVVFDGEIGAER